MRLPSIALVVAIAATAVTSLPARADHDSTRDGDDISYDNDPAADNHQCRLIAGFLFCVKPGPDYRCHFVDNELACSKPTDIGLMKLNNK